MGNIGSTNKSPYAYIADLFQSKAHKYYEHIQSKSSNFVVGRPMMKSDPFPSWYFTPVITRVKQTGIGDQKTTMQHHDMLIMYYTTDLDLDLFTIEQIIMQTIVGNNKIANTKQYKNTGQEFMQLKNVEYSYVYDEDNDLAMQSVFALVTITYQDSFNGVN